MSNENDQPLQVIKPAILPDDNILYWVLAVEIAAVLAGMILHKKIVVLLSLIFMAILPGIPLFFHSIFHFTATVKVYGNKITIHTLAGNGLVKIPGLQELYFNDIAYVYYLVKEITFLKNFCAHLKAFKKLDEETDLTFDSLSKKYQISREEYDEWLRKTKETFPDLRSIDPQFLLRTNLNLKNYVSTEKGSRGHIATARAKAYLVLSNKDGNKKTYFANLYDLSAKDSRGLLNTLKEKNPSIKFLMDTQQIRRLFPSLALIVLFLIAPHAYANEARADLTIVQGTNKRVLSENDFRQLHLDSVEVKDPVYNKHKRYAGYWLSDIFDLAGIHPDPNTVWTFTALDGYKASIAVADVLQSGAKAFVAIEDLDKEEGWEKFQQGKEWITPAPYYLVWQTPLADVTPLQKLPWPYQMVEISIHKADESLQKLLADSNDKSESVTRGYKVFQQSCVACHSLNLQGGGLGPELNVPKNILEYEDRNFLKEFIGNPSSFRAKSKMPAFNSTLSAQEINDVLDYLAWMGKHKKGESL